MSSLIASKFANRAAASISEEEVIRLEDVSVQYRVPQERIGTFKEYAIRWVQGKVKHRSFLALQNVDLSIRKGEVFGLIGQNGAGKSTLLKLVARVLRPTRGRVMVKGFVAPLLEIGAGFHPELTGRENVYLNGAMLGFTREEMEAKFQNIVVFAELGDFIDAPLRTYSSGMWARLGFAVATETQPEILIVDEILSVGDEAFQHKSYERIQSFQAHGTTILLVSHNMEMIEKMCQRAAWLDHGKIVSIGSAHAVINQYLGRTWDQDAKRLEQEIAIQSTQRWGSGKIEITHVRITDRFGVEQTVFRTGEKLTLEIEYLAHEPTRLPIFGIAIHRQDGVHITGPNTSFSRYDLPMVEGQGLITYTIPYLPLLEGLYNFSVAVTNQDDTEMYDYHDRAYPFRVVNYLGVGEKYGMITLRGEWQHRAIT